MISMNLTTATADVLSFSGALDSATVQVRVENVVTISLGLVYSPLKPAGAGIPCRLVVLYT